MSARQTTPKEDLINLHYERLGEELSWSSTRVRRLCAALQVTPEELAAFVRVRPGDFLRWVQDSRIPPTVELHLTLIERTVFPSVTHEPVFPCFSTSKS